MSNREDDWDDKDEDGEFSAGIGGGREDDWDDKDEDGEFSAGIGGSREDDRDNDEDGAFAAGICSDVSGGRPCGPAAAG